MWFTDSNFICKFCSTNVRANQLPNYFVKKQVKNDTRMRAKRKRKSEISNFLILTYTSDIGGLRIKLTNKEMQINKNILKSIKLSQKSEKCENKNIYKKPIR